jgi:glutamate-1-semialdehyde aminotransferase
MRLSRFFGGGKKNEPDEPDGPDETAAADEPTSDSEEADGIPEGDRDGDPDVEWKDRALDVVPGGASTGSKRFAALYGDGATGGPTHYIRASGCHVTTVGERTLIDCTMALGSVTLGYGDEAIARAVVQAAAAGHVTGLSHMSEIIVAERLCDIVPCAEQVRFLKSGAEAVSAAVRIARTYTGRNHVVGSGYFGWHDWASDDAGVPASVKAHFTRAAFDDVAALEAACSRAGNDLAAIVIEPVVERLPSREWLDAARRLCDAQGAVLVFDEIKTGFRLRPGGYQEYAGLEPDLATLGKAMANGFPISAVVGRAEVMQAATRTWISSTLAGEATALAAVAAVLDWHERAEVCDTLWSIGEEMMGAVRRAVTASGLPGISVEGIAPMWFVRFEDRALETRFLELAVEEGVLFKRGAYNFSSLAHDEETIIAIEAAASSALVHAAEELEERGDAFEDGEA